MLWEIANTCMNMISNASRILSLQDIYTLLPFCELCCKGFKSFVFSYKSYGALIIYYMIDFSSNRNFINNFSRINFIKFLWMQLFRNMQKLNTPWPSCNVKTEKCIFLLLFYAMLYNANKDNLRILT